MYLKLASRWNFIAVFLVCVFFASSCKKHETYVTDEVLLEQSRVWLNNQDVRLYAPDLEMMRLIRNGEERYVVIPSKYVLSNEDNKIKSSLVIDVSLTTFKGQIVETINSPQIKDEAKEAQLYSFLFDKTKILPVIDQNILSFSLTHIFQKGFEIEHGVMKNTVRLSKDPQNPKKISKGSGKIMAIDHEAADCTAWFYVVYNRTTGEIYTSTYLYTTCEVMGDTGGGSGGSGTNVIASPNLLDTTGLWKYPNFKQLVTNLPELLNNYPNILQALAYYTGFTTQQVIDVMKPGVGPKVSIVNLPNVNGRTLYGKYDKATQTLQINAALVNGLDAVNSPNRYKALGLLLTITTLHEFVHYGRDINNMSKLVFQNGTGVEAGWMFEMNIQPPGTGDSGINRNNAIEWINYYKYNFSD